MTEINGSPPEKTNRIYMLGEKGSHTRPRDDLQNFHHLRQECMKKNKLFKDPDFATDDSTLCTELDDLNDIQWTRPGELVKNPKLFVEDSSPSDIKHGALGICGFLASVALIATKPHIFNRVVPTDQSFDVNYAGIFHFRFWQRGKWVDVVIDDRLPTLNARLIYASSVQKNEFWLPLLEKAYAKLIGTYKDIVSSNIGQAMEDLTGGVSETFVRGHYPPSIFEVMLKSIERESLISVGRGLTPPTSGLYSRYAYSVTKVVQFSIAHKFGKVRLLRVKNPRGTSPEWTGSWSNGSEEWNQVPDEVKKDLGFDDGSEEEFWMCFDDFIATWSFVCICHMEEEPVSLNLQRKRIKWDCNIFEGSWVRGVCSGGSYENDTFYLNPQYRIKVSPVREDFDPYNTSENDCLVLINLHNVDPTNNIMFGIEMFLIENPRETPKPLDQKYFEDNVQDRVYDPTLATNSLVKRISVAPGVYCIIPFLSKPDVEGEYYLRVICENKTTMEVFDREIDIVDFDLRVKVHLNEDAQLHIANLREIKNRQYFYKLAGEGREIDWRRLQILLNYAMREELEFTEFEDAGFFITFTSQFWKMTTKEREGIYKMFESKGEGFSKEVCRSLLAMMDKDYTGKLRYDEFKVLWTEIKKWKAVFELHDADNDGEIDVIHLRNALYSASYILNSRILCMLIHRYGTGKRTIAFDDFIMCLIKLKQATDFIKGRDDQNMGSMSINVNEWLLKTLYS